MAYSGRSVPTWMMQWIMAEKCGSRIFEFFKKIGSRRSFAALDLRDTRCMCTKVRFGKRKARFHQWITKEGRPILEHQFGRVQSLMEMCSSIDKFKNAAEKQKKVVFCALPI